MTEFIRVNSLMGEPQRRNAAIENALARFKAENPPRTVASIFYIAYCAGLTAVLTVFGLVAALDFILG